MKKIITIIIALLCIGTTYAQLTITSGTHLVVNSGSTVIANGGITATNATITNDGTIEVKGDLVNNTSGLFAVASSGTVTFNGSAAQEITGDTDADFYGTLEIDNASGVSLTTTSTGADQTVNGPLTFINGLLTLNTLNLTIGTTNPTGADATKYIETNSTGGVIRSVPADGSTNVTYPLGNSAYNPLVLQNSISATTDSYNVRVLDNEPKNASTADMVNRSWVVTEEVAYGSELTVTPQWIPGEELSGFDMTNSAVGLTQDAGSTYNWKTYGAAGGGNPYTQMGNTYYKVGTFTVADKDYVSDNTIVEDVTIANTETDCFNAIDILYVADEVLVLVQTGSEATFIAGDKIIFYPGFEAEPGSLVDAHITTSNDFCGSLPGPIMANVNEESQDEMTEADFLADTEEFDAGKLIKTYPNPTQGQFVIDFMGSPYMNAEVYVISFRGQKMLNLNTQNRDKIDVDLSYLPNGLYLIVVKDADKVITKRIVKL